MRLRSTLHLALLIAATSCSRGTSYEVQGQIVAVDAARQELTVKHGDIKGFMPGMTMAFKVREESLMAGKAPGDLVRATLVVEDSIGYLTKVDVTGRAPLTEPPPRADGAVLMPGEAVSDVRLVDQDGVERQLSGWRGRVVAVTFVYTRCPLPDFCPLMDRRFAEIQRELQGETQLRDRVHLLSVSIDPSFDTPPVLREHARAAGAQRAIWSFVTGDRRDLERFGSALGVAIMPAEPGSAAVIHNLRTAVIDPEGRLTTIFGGNEWRAADLLKELRRAAGVA
jgi:protein SCO1/2